MGSKSRISKYIIPIIQQRIKDYDIKTYIEPFCGGCNIIDKIQCDTKIASDNHKYLIEMFKNLNQIQILPEFITKEHYSDVRECFNKGLTTYPDWYIGAIGFLASYNGRFFDGGYSGIVHTKAGTERNYYDEARRNLLMQISQLKDIQFQCGDYEELYSDKVDCLLYCDIPYYGASGIVDYVKDYIFDCDLLLISEDGANLLARNTPIAFSISGKSWVNNHAHVLKFKTYAERKYVEYYLNSIDLTPYISGAAQPKLNKKSLESIRIPNPSPEDKKRIVEILDKFDALTGSISDGLPREIELRQKQYEHYRNLLLSFPKSEKVKV